MHHASCSVAQCIAQSDSHDSSDVQQIRAEGHPVTICQGGLLWDEHIVDIDHIWFIASPLLFLLNLDLALQPWVALLDTVLCCLSSALQSLTYIAMLLLHYCSHGKASSQHQQIHTGKFPMATIAGHMLRLYSNVRVWSVEATHQMPEPAARTPIRTCAHVIRNTYKQSDSPPLSG